MTIIQELPYFPLPSLPCEKAVTVEMADLTAKKLLEVGGQNYFHSHKMHPAMFDNWAKDLEKWRKSHR